ncbi:MAG: spore cortex-lytic enzyme [Clostridia bacterium]|nr:spore cortex-lytic enzyme [Clostridia bacterium]
MRKKKILLVIVATALALLLNTSYYFRNEISSIYGYARATISYYGSSGQEVIDIQAKLYKWGYYKGIVDGKYGYKTYQAVRSFQAKNGLKVDGVAGPQTLAALGLPTRNTSPSTAATTSASGDVRLLAHLIHGEARGEPYTGQVAVGAVIMNRIRDGRFPKTIAGVIYQPGAFDAVKDGQINLAPTTTSYKAARDALNGWDPSGGAVYYFNPSTATSKWIWTRTIIRVIGKHYFAK